MLPEEQKPADIAATDAELKRDLAAFRRAPIGTGGRRRPAAGRNRVAADRGA